MAEKTQKMDCQYETSEACSHNLRAARDAMDVIQGKWRIPILVSLTYGNKRFGELQRDLSDISPKMLSKELKSLEENKLINRTVYDGLPLTVEYSLTSLGLSMGQMLDKIIDWGVYFRKEIVQGK